MYNTSLTSPHYNFLIVTQMVIIDYCSFFIKAVPLHPQIII